MRNTSTDAMDAASAAEPPRDRREGGVASLRKAAAVLRLLGGSRLPRQISDIARETGMTPSSCHDVVSTLARIGLVQPSASGRTWEIGARFTKLATQALGDPERLGPARPALIAIADRWNANLGVMRGFGPTRAISTCIIESTAAIRLRMPVGYELPLFGGVVGRIFAAWGDVADPAERRLRIAEAGFSDKEALISFERRCAEDRAQGWVHGEAQWVAGVGVVAAPMLDPQGGLIGAMSLAMFGRSFREAPLQALAEDVQEAAALGALRLGPAD
ncbi:helix-turn-helix domain-containing protein [uncultured Albimonas sp.]|uniref:IclR family transcriptional regulator n=1 Tax=uncultured Albimonas sp. TaxID=1331701 RepID=UPI0030EE3E3C